MKVRGSGPPIQGTRRSPVKRCGGGSGMHARACTMCTVRCTMCAMLAIYSSLVASCWLKKEKSRTLISFRTWRGWRLIRIYHLSLSLSLSHASDRRRVALSHRHINPLSRSASAPPSSHGRVRVRIADYSNTMGCRVR